MAVSIPKFQGCCIIRSCIEFTQNTVALFGACLTTSRLYKTKISSLQDHYTGSETATVPCIHACNAPLLALKLSNHAQRVSLCTTLNVSDPHHHFQLQALFHGRVSL